jgi:DNA-binding transcriptional MerR regulator
MFKIGDFSKLSMISIRMLRHYHQIGLLVPKDTDASNGYRYYTADQLSRANQIQALRNMGIGLSTIKNILEQYQDKEAFKQYLKLHYKQVIEEAQEAERKLQMIQVAIKHLEKEDICMEYNVAVKILKESTVMSLRRVIPAYQDEGMLWKELNEEAARQRVKREEPDRCVAVFFDEGYKESDVDVEIRMNVVGTYQDTESVKFQALPAVTAATVIVKGDYSHMGGACEALGKWINDNGYEINGQMFNIYHVPPTKDTNPENWVTEVCFPVKKR